MKTIQPMYIGHIFLMMSQFEDMKNILHHTAHCFENAQYDLVQKQCVFKLMQCAFLHSRPKY
jgi:hypothetical protein